jgi:putative Mn2+ efflux pump MntP
MDLISILLIGIGLAMDAFAVSICKSMAIKKGGIKNALLLAICFGLFQFAMPILGYFMGTSVATFTQSFAHWIALALLVYIGVKMIMEAIKGGEECSDRLDFKELMVLGLATSIDALAVGVSFALLDQPFFLPSVIIGIITFVISFSGAFFGRKIGTILSNKAGIFGGIVLILIGIRILLQGLGIL